MTGTKLIVARVNFHEFPRLCASCLATDDLEYKIVRSPSLFFSDSFEVSVPLCPRCLRKTTWRRPLSIALLVAASAVAIIGDRSWHPSRFWPLLVAFIPLLDALVGQRLQGPVRVQAKSDGGLIFWFSNPDYAHLFEAKNQCSYDSESFTRVL